MSFRNWRNQKWFPYTVAVCAGVLLYVILTNLSPISITAVSFLTLFHPLLTGAIFAYIIDPLAVFLEKHVLKKMKKPSLRRKVAVILDLIIVLAVIGILLATLIPQLAQSIVTFVSSMDSYTVHIQYILDELNARIPSLNLDFSKLVSTGTDALNRLFTELPAYLKSIAVTASAAGSRLGNILLGLILAIYFLLDKKRILGWLRELFSLVLGDRNYSGFTSFWKRCNDIMIRYIVFELIDSLIVGVVNFIFMVIMQMPYTVLVSVVVGITNLIPTFGPLIGGAVGFLILLLADPAKALIFLIFTCVLQFVDGYLLKPRLFGGSLGIPSVLILISIILGGKLAGIAGILLAIPFAAILSFVYREAFIPWLESLRKPKPEITPPPSTDSIS